MKDNNERTLTPSTISYKVVVLASSDLYFDVDGRHNMERAKKIADSLSEKYGKENVHVERSMGYLHMQEDTVEL